MAANDDEPIQLTDDDTVSSTEDELLANAIPIEGDDDPLKPIEITDAPLSTDPEASFAPLEVAEEDASEPKKEIKKEYRRKPHDEHWNRQPNITGAGAIHVKTFLAKLRPDSLENMDANINEWLDAHPEYEVKFVTTSVGDLVGKSKEPALFVNVWV